MTALRAPVYPPAVARTTVFGAGAMGTAVAMHLARAGNETTLWAAPWDAAVLPSLSEQRRHPGLPEFLPDALKVLGPAEMGAALDGLEVAVMGAHSVGARNLARTVMNDAPALPITVTVAKGLEPRTRKRMSAVYAEEIGHTRIVTMGGPCLAPELAEGRPSAAVLAGVDAAAVDAAAAAFSSGTLSVWTTDDVIGVEYCTVAKNVAAIGMGIVDGIGKVTSTEFRNAKAALYTQAVHELAELVMAFGGRRETATGLAGVGDTLVTSLGGRNRLYGELIGEGADPKEALADLERRGMTVEGVESARDVAALAAERSLHLPLHRQVAAVLFDDARPESLFGCLGGMTR